MTDTPDMDELVGAKDLDFEQVLTYVFGIQSHKSWVCLALLDNSGSTAAGSAEVLDHGRSNVNRSLTTLLDKDLTERKRHLLGLSGYIYQHTAVPLPEAKEIMHAASNE